MNKRSDLKEKGITLVALVVTIIVLLILAGISISLVLGNNGIIARARDASVVWNNAQHDEEERMGEIERQMEELGPETPVDWEYAIGHAEKHPDQSSTNNDIGIGTDGKPVNLDYWDYKVFNGNEITLTGDNGCGGDSTGYHETEIENGKIKGKVPQYIKKDGNSEFYTVTKMSCTFNSCDTLVIAPKIPETVTNMNRAFAGTGLVDAPVIPDSVTSLSQTFQSCRSLKNAPVIPNSVYDLYQTFDGCHALTGDLVINCNYIDSYTDCLWWAAINEGTDLKLSGSCTQLSDILGSKSSNAHVSLK